MTELKPCPFCKGEACADKLFTTKQPSSYFIYCKSCAVESAAFPTLKEAIDFWNTQQPQDINWQPIESLPTKPMPILLHGQNKLKHSIYLPAQILEANDEGICLIATEGGLSSFSTIKKIYTYFAELTPPEVEL